VKKRSLYKIYWPHEAVKMKKCNLLKALRRRLRRKRSGMPAGSSGSEAEKQSYRIMQLCSFSAAEKRNLRRRRHGESGLALAWRKPLAARAATKKASRLLPPAKACAVAESSV